MVIEEGIKTLVSLIENTQQVKNAMAAKDTFVVKQCQSSLFTAREVSKKYGNSALDFFKAGKDKLFFWSKTRESFVSYTVRNNCALVLGDPLGERGSLESLIREFSEFCKAKNWQLAFFQTQADFLDIYQNLGFRKLKIGDDAILDHLESFELTGKKWKDFRNRMRKAEKTGITIKKYTAPISQEIMDEVEAISKEWLKFPGRKERAFSLGHYDREYLQGSDLFCAYNPDGRMMAFLNTLESGVTGEITVDLMRRSMEAPSGIMDSVFIYMLMDAKEQGYTRFNVGLAPMSGFARHENASMIEKAVHGLFKNLNFIFDYIGLKTYKAKFATSWEPRYLIYKNLHDLPSLALTIKSVLEG